MSESNEPLVWDLPEPAGRAAGPMLSRDRIVRAALAIADEHGVEAVTMRRVATALGSSTPMSLYRYVGGKGGIVDLMLDAVYGELELPAQPSGDWRADLTLLARRERDTLRRHPWFVALSHHRPMFGPNALWHNEWALRAVDGLGLDVSTMMSIVGMVVGHAQSYAQHEAEEARMRGRIGVTTDAELRATASAHVDRIAADPRYPTLARWIREAHQVAPDEQFTLGLNCLLDGIAGRLVDR
ncbi:TetR family transcriptional regulator [Actinocatenispora thailandica]|uniref:TetR family transcriptional regulator n=1 Tax=Actinocatenispora thailandica TaxID=227318 RepID=A0A7R7I013_9ACTN|nr:TetR/AcrR family transcriptional regulator [Actinocatenispora thailandica]BCJ38838.1 TetR family transcriptional regulator [Actinocatenispora thailandica]